MRSKARWVVASGALPAVALLSDGCRTPTQVTVDIGTNVVCADMRGVEIVVAADAHEAERRAALDAPGIRYATASTTACTEGPEPRKVGTLVVTPGSGDGAVVVVAAFGGVKASDCVAPSFAPGCIVARRRFAFVDHTAVTLPIVLDPSCSGIPCNENSTCVGKKCVDSVVDCSSGTCGGPGRPSPDGGLVEVDAASPLDSSVVADGSADGPVEGSTGDASQDGPVEGGPDGGGVRGTCPTAMDCGAVQGKTCASAGALVACCSDSDPATCKPPGTCAAFSGCCRDSTDCQGADICCASTMVALSTTYVSCKSRSDCAAGMGKVVCSTVGPTGCGGGACIAALYRAKPDYYFCS
ncbi:hypothetical protein BH11MYX4_BH11MYX4_53320 [soil metagenome]